MGYRKADTGHDYRVDDSHKEQSRRYFDGISDRYDLTFAGRHSAALVENVLNKLSRVSYRSLLDIGCGTGNLLAVLSEIEDGVRLAGLDISPGMIKVAKRRLDGRADIRVGDSENLPWADGTFDVVVSTDSFHHYPHPVRVLYEIRRVLGSDGLLIIAEPWWPTPIRQLVSISLPFARYGDVTVYSEESIRRLLRQSGFTDIAWERVGRSGCIVAASANRDNSAMDDDVTRLVRLR